METGFIQYQEVGLLKQLILDILHLYLLCVILTIQTIIRLALITIGMHRTNGITGHGMHIIMVEPNIGQVGTGKVIRGTVVTR